MNKKFGMSILLILGFFLFSTMTSPAAATTTTKKDVSPQNIIQQEKIPLYFIPNQGQFDEKALFLVNTSQYRLWITRSGLLFDSLRAKEASKTQRSVSALHFPGSLDNAHVEAADLSEYRVNYFLGNNPDQWKTGIPAARSVLYQNLYENIDLKLYGQGNRLEYDWVIKPKANPADIQISFEGATNVEVNENGDLLIRTDLCTFVHKKPHAFQTIDGNKTSVHAEYQKTGDKIYGFSLGSYNADRTLVIDPLVFIYATFLGGDDMDEAYDIAVDKGGCPYITGATASLDFPTTVGAYSPVLSGGTDVFVTKFNASGSDLVYSTFLGGTSNEEGYSIALDPEEVGFAHIVGTTSSSDFPTTSGVYDRSINGSRDIFVAKLSHNGAVLKFSTFLGGRSNDNGFGITLDQKGDLYLTGSTASTDFPTTRRADSRVFGGQVDTFVTKMDGEATSLLYSTYVGGEDIEVSYDIAVNENGSTFITGYIWSGEEDDDWDVLSVRLNRRGSAQLYWFVFGGSDNESGRGIVVDQSHFAYIVGWTASTDFPVTPEAFDTTHNGHTDAFVSKVKGDGSGFAFSTYLGGNCWDWGEDIDIYEDLSAIVTGYTTAADFPVTPNAFDTTHNGHVDAFVTKFDPPGSFLKYSTFLGGEESDYGMGIILDKDETAHTTGYTSSPNFPVIPKAYDDTFNLVSDAYYVKFALVWPISIEITYPANGASVAGLVNVTTEVTSESPVADVEFYVNDELLSTDFDSPYGFTWDTSNLSNGAYKIKAFATDADGYGAFHEITVYLLKDTLDLQVTRGIYQTWLHEKPYAELKMTVLSSEVLEKADYYAFFRRKGDENFTQIVAYPKSDLVDNAIITFKDMPLEADQTYTYYVLAVTEEGEILGISPEITK